MTKYLVFLVGVGAVATLGFTVHRQSQVAEDRPEPRLSQQMIFASGRVEGATPEIGLRPQLAGRVTQVLIREGQMVERGQILVQLDDDEYRQEVGLAAAEVELAEAQLARLVNGAQREQRDEAAALYQAKLAELEQAQLSQQRIVELRKVAAVSQQEADNQRTRVAGLEQQVAAAKARMDLLQTPARPDEVRIEAARIQAAKARLALAQVRWERTRLRAPFAGMVLQSELEAGELIAPDSAKPAVVMADASRYRVRAFVEEMDAPRVEEGMSAKIVADGLPGVEFTGSVGRLSPRMSRKELYSDRPTERHDTKVREVWIDLDQGRPWLVGLRVDVLISLRPASNTPTAPQTAQSPDSAARSPLAHNAMAQEVQP